MSTAYAQSCGFESDTELYRMLASVPMDTTQQKQAFLRWRETDGTKAGLEKLLKGEAE